MCGAHSVAGTRLAPRQSCLRHIHSSVCRHAGFCLRLPRSPHYRPSMLTQVRKVIGPFATPDYVILTAALPKTRSGKIMRRVLRKIIAQQTDQLGERGALVVVVVVCRPRKIISPRFKERC